MSAPSDSSAARRERIELLLEWFNDVEAGMRDIVGTGEHIPLMCRAWRKPVQGYPELRFQLGQLSGREPRMYRHLAWWYFHSSKRRASVCPRCNVTMHASQNFHKHGRDTVAVVPRMLRVHQGWVRRTVVDEAIDWLEANWRGAVFVPDELMPEKQKDAA